MRPLNRNERLLAAAFGAIVFLIANLVGMRWIGNQMNAAKNDITRLEAEAEQARLMLAQRPYWQARQSWVAEHPPGVYDEATSRAKYVQEVQSGLEAHKLKISSQQPLETERDGRLALVGIDLTIQGRLEEIVRWLQSVQQPGNYETVRSFTLKDADDVKTMEAQIRLGKVLRAADLPSYP